MNTPFGIVFPQFPILIRLSSTIPFVNRDTARGKFRQQLGNGGIPWRFGGNTDCPLQVFAKFPGADAPVSKYWGDRGSDLNDRPMPDERAGRRLVREWTAHDEMIIAMYKNAEHFRND
jgi:hypothetical protein